MRVSATSVVLGLMILTGMLTNVDAGYGMVDNVEIPGIRWRGASLPGVGLVGTKRVLMLRGGGDVGEAGEDQEMMQDNTMPSAWPLRQWPMDAEMGEQLPPSPHVRAVSRSRFHNVEEPPMGAQHGGFHWQARTPQPVIVGEAVTGDSRVWAGDLAPPDMSAPQGRQQPPSHAPGPDMEAQGGTQEEQQLIVCQPEPPAKPDNAVASLFLRPCEGSVLQSAAVNAPWPARYICTPLAWLDVKSEPSLHYAILPFSLARLAARAMRIRSLKRWLDACCDGRVREDVPWDPESVYRDRWVSWNDWLGVQRRERTVRSLCEMCNSRRASRGVPGERHAPEGGWSKLVCKPCAEGLSGTSRLNRRCEKCHRPATFGPSPEGEEGVSGTLQRCRIHRLPGDVVLLSRICEILGCTRSPTFAAVNATAPAVCARHRREGDMNVVSRRCRAEGCDKYPSFGNVSDRVPIRCGYHKMAGQINVYAKLCKHPEGCALRASFGFPNGSRPLFCYAHKQPLQVNMNGVHCTHGDCGKIASYGDAATGHMRSCMQHRGEGDVQIRKNACEHPMGCSRRASYGNSTTRSCAQHRDPSHHALTAQLCTARSCGKHAAYGDASVRPFRAVYCAGHKLPSHINLKNPTCTSPGCKLSARFGDFPGGLALTCSLHRLKHHKDVKNRLCVVSGCGKHAYFCGGVEEGGGSTAGRKAQRCAEHKLDSDTDIRNKKCKTEDCGKQPIFGEMGGRAVHCSAHKGPGEIDVRNAHCSVPGCFRRALRPYPGGSKLHGKVCTQHFHGFMGPGAAAAVRSQAESAGAVDTARL